MLEHSALIILHIKQSFKFDGRQQHWKWFNSFLYSYYYSFAFYQENNNNMILLISMHSFVTKTHQNQTKPNQIAKESEKKTVSWASRYIYVNWDQAERFLCPSTKHPLAPILLCYGLFHGTICFIQNICAFFVLLIFVLFFFATKDRRMKLIKLAYEAPI